MYGISGAVTVDANACHDPCFNFCDRMNKIESNTFVTKAELKNGECDCTCGYEVQGHE